MDSTDVVHEVPNSLKRLVRMVMRGFYPVEYVVVIDMLIRNPCMKEDDLVDLLQFERKQLRAILSHLKSDRFVKVRLRMETGPDGKASRQNYYYINYKVFVNVVKYKLDHMRRRIETEERDSTSRASFRCTQCGKTFTDLEADQLCDFTTGEFRCSFCTALVEEDQSALPKKDSRLILAHFNEQIEPLYNLLRDVEDVKLAPELLEPEPTDISHLKRESGLDKKLNKQMQGQNSQWSGEATRHIDYKLTGEQSSISVNFGDAASQEQKATVERKAQPIWMTESTVINERPQFEETGLPNRLEDTTMAGQTTNPIHTKTGYQQQDDIMEALLQHEKKGNNPANAVNAILQPHASGDEKDTSESDNEFQGITVEADLKDGDSEDDVAYVMVGGQKIPLDEITEQQISSMTPSEKEAYIKLGQEMYAHMYD